MSKPYAQRHPTDVSKRILPDGRVVSRAVAQDMGYDIGTPPVGAVATPTPAQAQAEARYAATKYEAAIMALPESDDRPFAAGHLAKHYTAETMPLDKAAGLLRGLPPEPAPVSKADRAADHAKQVRLEQLQRAARSVRG